MSEQPYLWRYREYDEAFDNQIDMLMLPDETGSSSLWHEDHGEMTIVWWDDE